MQSPVDNFSIHDLSYNHYMEHHISPTDHYHDHTHTVYTKPVDALPKFQFLAYDNYLNEFKSEVDKARVRFNLGIPDLFSFNWGNIQGSIEEQQDLVSFINSRTEGALNWRTTVDSKIQDINTLIGLLSNRLGGTANSALVENIADSLQGLTTEINKIWTDLANNGRDITSLYNLLTGGSIDTSLTSLITLNSSNISALQNQASQILSRLAELESNNNLEINSLIASINTRLALLEENQTDSTIRTELANLSARVEQLLREIGSNTLIELVTSNTSWEVTPTSDDIPVIITAKYSQMKDRDVTNMCNVVSSNRNIATWNEETSKIEINNEITETSTVSLTFTYGEQSLIINVKVLVELPITEIPCYFGYGSSWEDIFNVDKFKVADLNGDWTSQSILKISLEVTNRTRLWICIPSTATLQISTGGLSVPTSKLAAMQHINDVYYLVYYTSIVNTYDITYNIVING